MITIVVSPIDLLLAVLCVVLLCLAHRWHHELKTLRDTADTMLKYINAHIDGDEDLMANIYKSRERDDA